MIAFIGDVHRAFGTLARIVEELPETVTAVVQVGDLGLCPADLAAAPPWLPRLRRPVHFIGGNHDYEPWFRGLDAPTELEPNLIYVPRGLVLELDGRRVAFLGGGDSIIDRASRSEGVDWWPEERVTADEVSRLASAGRVDVLVAHTPPAVIYPMFGLRPDPSALEVQRAWEMLGRPALVCGHLHRAKAIGTVRTLAPLELLIA